MVYERDPGVLPLSRFADDEPDIYTAWAITSRGREEIECYSSLNAAVRDMLELWPEDDDGDISIETRWGRCCVYMARGNKDPRIVHVYYVSETKTAASYVESFRCEYEADEASGKIKTNIHNIG